MQERWILRAMMAASCCMAMAAGAQGGAGSGSAVRDPLFAGAEKFERGAVSTVAVENGPVTLDHAQGKDSDRRHNASDVYVFKYERDGAYDPAEVKPYADRLGTGGWSCETIQSRRKAGAYRYKCRKPLAEGYHESVDIIVEARQLVFVHGISNHEDHDSEDW